MKFLVKLLLAVLVLFWFGQTIQAQPDESYAKWLTTTTRSLAEKGDPQSQFILGICYYFGKGMATNYAESEKWLRKAAEQNFAPAQGLLGEEYIYGRSFSQNYVEGAKLLQKAAAQNNAQAQYYCSMKVHSGKSSSFPQKNRMRVR